MCWIGFQRLVSDLCVVSNTQNQWIINFYSNNDDGYGGNVFHNSHENIQKQNGYIHRYCLFRLLLAQLAEVITIIIAIQNRRLFSQNLVRTFRHGTQCSRKEADFNNRAINARQGNSTFFSKLYKVLYNSIAPRFVIKSSISLHRQLVISTKYQTVYLYQLQLCIPCKTQTKLQNVCKLVGYSRWIYAPSTKDK